MENPLKSCSITTVFFFYYFLNKRFNYCSKKMVDQEKESFLQNKNVWLQMQCAYIAPFMCREHSKRHMETTTPTGISKLLVLQVYGNYYSYGYMAARHTWHTHQITYNPHGRNDGFWFPGVSGYIPALLQCTNGYLITNYTQGYTNHTCTCRNYYTYT